LGIVAIIPARYASTRLPGKALSDIHGKPMIQHVYERVRAAHVDRVVVATDDDRILAAVRAFGGEAVMTSKAHRSGTDRVAETARGLSDEIIVNVQGDEPLLDPRQVDAAIEPLRREAGVSLATLSTPIRELSEMLSPSVVKVVVDERRDALYFSRSLIPYVRLDGASDAQAAASAAVTRGLAERHIGLYVYRRDTLLRLSDLPPAPLEQAEALEQLRALHHGLRMRVVRVDTAPGPAVDTLEDLERVRALLAAESRPPAHAR
jgi:3-deoxy-manno-octulosonate cytidylyltransferase (CMP-KDO synthetase)